jgi:predicted DNA-binding protein (MmcQ/YjbR family)
MTNGVIDIETIRDYCLQKKGVTESFPFDEKNLVFKVMNKIFALVDIETCDFILLKCHPDKVVELREQFTGVRPGYYSNKRHWNTVMLHEDVPANLIFDWIDHSFEQVLAGLSKKKQAEWSNSL